MRYYFAPMEGLTGYLFRQTHAKYFPGVDRYFMPFYSPSQEHSFTRRAFQDLLPEHNDGLDAVPQLLTRRAEDFLWAAERLAGLGYREVNLNLGCPSGTVTAKGKGAGFLAHPDELRRFLDEAFSRCPISISVKTRLGVSDPDEFPALLDIYNQYPIRELTIHPRVRSDFYKGRVRLEDFATALPRSKNPVCYNGDVTTTARFRALTERFPSVEAVMLGRGLVSNPALARQLQGGPGADRTTLRAFHDTLYEGYASAFSSRRNASLRMKELWFYLIHLFADSGRHLKRLRKAADAQEFEQAAAAVFQYLPLLEELPEDWQATE
ncbi:MAG TPA: tRNA-dihydrouridine synthase family protein [Pseudoflavonifractor sp.]|nr:tRNA-dihydrouridine synthase family protein [Pseudoflavonifractor sp.]